VLQVLRDVQAAVAKPNRKPTPVPQDLLADDLDYSDQGPRREHAPRAGPFRSFCGTDVGHAAFRAYRRCVISPPVDHAQRGMVGRSLRRLMCGMCLAPTPARR
jgi:hypothetical protein